MTKKKSFITLLLAFCLMIPAMFVLTACGETDRSHANVGDYAGKYISYSYGSSCKKELVLDLKENGDYKFSQTTYRGTTVEKTELTGWLSIGENHKLSAFKFDNLLDAKAYEEFLGNIVPDNSTSSISMEVIYMQDLFSDIMKTCCRIYDDYFVIYLGDPDDSMVLYKEGVERYASNQFLTLFTAKDFNDLAIISATITDATMKYANDFYFVKDSFDLTTEEGKTGFAAELFESGMIVVSDGEGGLTYYEPATLDVTDFDLTKTGAKTSTLKWTVADKEFSVKVNYTVVADETGLPIEQIKEAYLLDTLGRLSDKVLVEKDTDFYGLNWSFKYATFDSDSGWTKLDLNETNCSGNKQVFEVTGYDKTKTGWQMVSVKFRDYEVKQAVFVYSDDCNPAMDTHVLDESKVVITATEGENPVYSLDCSNAKFKFNYADGSQSEEITLTKDQILDLGELANYVNTDDITFAYEYKFDNVTYTFYISVQVEVTPA